MADFERLNRCIFAREQDKEKDGENHKLGEQGRTHTWHMIPRGVGNHYAERILSYIEVSKRRETCSQNPFLSPNDSVDLEART